MHGTRGAPTLLLAAVLSHACASKAPTSYDIVLRGGTVYDGSGAAPFVGDVAIAVDRIVAIGDLGDAVGGRGIDVASLAVAPGFVNMLSWATDSLIVDGRSQSDIRQGVPLEVFVEGTSYGPLNDEVVYLLMSENNIEKQIALPWVSFASDAGSLATEGRFILTSTHPRAYGTFARLLGRYVRDRTVIPLEEAIRKLSALPSENLGIADRGRLQKGYFADLAVFDPDSSTDHATYELPHQYATGMVHVFVNGEQVLRNGEHTGALPGRAVYGPGKSD